MNPWKGQTTSLFVQIQSPLCGERKVGAWRAERGSTLRKVADHAKSVRKITFVIIAKSEQRTQQRIENTTLLDNRQGLNLRAQSRKMLLAQVEPDIRNVHKHVVAHWTNIKLQIRKEFCDRRRQRGLILFNKTFSSQRHFKTILIYWHSTFWQEYNFRFTAFHVLLARRVKPLSLYRTKMTLPFEYLPAVSRTGSFSVHVKALY